MIVFSVVEVQCGPFEDYPAWTYLPGWTGQLTGGWSFDLAIQFQIQPDRGYVRRRVSWSFAEFGHSVFKARTGGNQSQYVCWWVYLRTIMVFFKVFNVWPTIPLFSELMISSGLVLMPQVKWLSFHAGYDFGYLVNLLTCQNLPDTESDFFELLKLFCPNIYDVK